MLISVNFLNRDGAELVTSRPTKMSKVERLIMVKLSWPDAVKIYFVIYFQL